MAWILHNVTGSGTPPLASLVLLLNHHRIPGHTRHYKAMLHLSGIWNSYVHTLGLIQNQTVFVNVSQ